jgi:LysR family transcriptional activator of nhaA
MLLPTSNSPLRRGLEEWFDAQQITPKIVGEFEDSALMNRFAKAEGCVFPAPSAIADRPIPFASDTTLFLPSAGSNIRE